MTTPTNAYGLLLRTHNRHGTEYLIAEIVRREDDRDAPRNCSDGLYTREERPKHLEGLALEGLRIEGWMTDYGVPTFLAAEPRFRDMYEVTECSAKRMLKTLKRVNDRIRSDDAHEPVDVFAALCTALRLSFVVECREDTQRSSYDDNNWRWMTIGEGRNRYRQMIEDISAAKQAIAAA